MYEIWLMLNIVYEMALDAWPWLLALAVLWLLLMVRALRRSGPQWRASLPPALVLGVLAAALAFFLAPGISKSALSEMKYWVDWANLLGIASAAGALGLVFAWPLLTGLRRKRSPA